jgi:predicted ATPase
MMKQLRLNDFKAFEEESFAFGKLNILSGLNNSGKSTVLQAIRILDKMALPQEMGTLTDFVRDDKIGFCIESLFEHNTVESASRFSYNRKEDTPGASGTDVGSKSLLSYISADRLGPRTSLPLSKDLPVKTVGICGEHIVDFLAEFEKWHPDLRIPKELSIDGGTGVMWNIQEWLRSISPGIDFSYYIDQKAEIGRTEFDNHKSIHTGFGLSYSLPVIASILVHAAQLEKQACPILLLIENPEAHLHPSGQTLMGRLIALGAECGLQIFVETHSEHLVNGIRIAVKNGILPPDDVKCFFFAGGDKEKNEPANVRDIYIDRHGMMDYWPDGFFDETEKNLLDLL